MALSDGDLFVSGSILSYQQANRIYQNFRGATVPSALQAGALFSDSDIDRLFHQGTALYEVYTEKSGTLFGNQVPNSECKVWSHSALAQGTTGVQSDYEIGSAIYNETGESADDSGNWTKTDCTMARTNDAGNGAGGSDYYYTITESAATQRISEALSGLTVGKLYKFSVFINNGTGTWASAVLQITNNALDTTIESTALATSVGWNDYSVMFVATEANNQMVLDLALGGGETAKLDNMRVIEVGPGCFAADDKALDIWTKTSTLDLLRIQADTTHCKGLYGIEVTKGAAGAEYLSAFGRIYNKEDHYARFRGKTVALGCYVYSVSAADNVKLQISDSDGNTESSFVAADTLTWVEITRTCGATITSFAPRILFDGDSSDVAYVSRLMLIEGSSIGEGNYQPKQQELIYLETNILSKGLNDTSDWSTGGWYALNLEADSDGMLPKGCKAVSMIGSFNDSGSSGASVYFQVRGSATMLNWTFFNLSGVTDDSICRHAMTLVGLGPDGDFEYYFTASGGATFDVPMFRYVTVQVN